MTLVDGMKYFLCIIKNDGTTPAQLPQDNAAALCGQIVIQ